MLELNPACNQIWTQIPRCVVEGASPAGPDQPEGWQRSREGGVRAAGGEAAQYGRQEVSLSMYVHYV